MGYNIWKQNYAIQKSSPGMEYVISWVKSREQYSDWILPDIMLLFLCGTIY